MNSEERASIREQRRHLKKEYQELFTQIVEILFRHDPIGINFETNTDEYEPEAGTILAGLKDCASDADVKRLVCREFRLWFGDEIGPESNYDPIAGEIWQRWKGSQARPNK